MSNISLSTNQVHIWELRISESNMGPEEFYKNTLSIDEKERADRLRFPKDRTNFVLSRGHLRGLLSKYLGLPASEIEFQYNRYGKPYLNKKPHPHNIDFNLSHSNDIALYAVANGREVGIDVEYIREVRRAGKIIDRFFSNEERAYYKNQPEENQNLTFFRLWCAREACTKAIGYGFNLPRSEFDITLVPGESNKNIDTPDRDGAGVRIYEISVDAGYIADLAVYGNKPEILCRRINEHD